MDIFYILDYAIVDSPGVASVISIRNIPAESFVATALFIVEDGKSDSFSQKMASANTIRPQLE